MTMTAGTPMAGGIRTMKGSITQLLKKQRCGFILSEEGNEVYFNDDGVEGAVSDFRVGSWVEFEIQYGLERPHALNVKKVLSRDKQRPVGTMRG